MDLFSFIFSFQNGVNFQSITLYKLKKKSFLHENVYFAVLVLLQSRAESHHGFAVVFLQVHV